MSVPLLRNIPVPEGGFKAILADPPWKFEVWSGDSTVSGSRLPKYKTMRLPEIGAMDVQRLAARDCVLFIWGIWSMIPQCERIISDWGFTLKTCAAVWVKGDPGQIDMFTGEIHGKMGMGYWVRQDSEYCLLATRGKPKRMSAKVRQSIIGPRRAHSKKPDCLHDRIEQLVEGPYLELFARASRPGWTCWGDEIDMATAFDWLGPDERRRVIVKKEGRMILHPGPLFSQQWMADRASD